MSHRLRFLVLVAGALLVALAAPLAGAEEAAAPAADVEQFLAWLAADDGVAVAPACSASPGAEAAAGGEIQLACSCIPECSSNRDCDRICGGKGLGQCVQVNSCCRECSCLALAIAA